jgi:predicted Zn-dependent peptidase
VEDAFQRGATSLLAPLMCRATESRSPIDIDALLTTRGMQLTTASNLHRLDLGMTCFSADVPLAMELLVDCLVKAALPGDELELMRQRANTEAANDPWERRFLAELRAVTLAGHYAAADPRSAKAGLAHLDRSVLLAQYRRLAVGSNTMLVVYGRFDRDVIIEHARRLLTQRTELVDGATVLPRGVPWGERTQASLTVITHDAPTAAVALVWHGPALADRARDEAPMLALGALLEARLARFAVATDAVPTRLGTTGESYDQRGIWLVWGSCDEARLDQVQQGVRDEVARFIAQLWLPEGDRGALPEGELAAAKATCAVRWALEQEDLDRVAARHATQLLLGQEVALDLAMPERLTGVTRKDLLRVAQAWLASDPLTVIAKPKSAQTGSAGSTLPVAGSTIPVSPTPVGAVPAAPVQGGPQPTAPMPTTPRPAVPGVP